MAIKEIKTFNKAYKISYEIKNPKFENYILILHGWGANKELMIKAFGKYFENIKQVYVDLPGFGGSNMFDPLNTRKYAVIIKEFIKTMPNEPRIIMGHSFGGKVATLLKPKHLVLLSTAGIVEEKPLSVKLKIKTFKALKSAGLGNLYKLFATKDVEGMSRQMYETLKNVVDEDFRDIFSKTSSKTLIFWGESDRAVNLKSGELINRLIKESEFYPLNGDHFFFLLHAKFIADTITKKFIENSSINESLSLNNKFSFDENDEFSGVEDVFERDINLNERLDEVLNLKRNKEKNIISSLEGMFKENSNHLKNLEFKPLEEEFHEENKPQTIEKENLKFEIFTEGVGEVYEREYKTTQNISLEAVKNINEEKDIKENSTLKKEDVLEDCEEEIVEEEIVEEEIVENPAEHIMEIFTEVYEDEYKTKTKEGESLEFVHETIDDKNLATVDKSSENIQIEQLGEVNTLKKETKENNELIQEIFEETLHEKSKISVAEKEDIKNQNNEIFEKENLEESLEQTMIEKPFKEEIEKKSTLEENQEVVKIGDKEVVETRFKNSEDDKEESQFSIFENSFYEGVGEVYEREYKTTQNISLEAVKNINEEKENSTLKKEDALEGFKEDTVEKETVEQKIVENLEFKPLEEEFHEENKPQTIEKENLKFEIFTEGVGEVYEREYKDTNSEFSEIDKKQESIFSDVYESLEENLEDTTQDIQEFPNNMQTEQNHPIEYQDEIYQKETVQNKDLEDEFIYKVCKKEENNKKEKLPHVKRFSDIYIERIKRAIERLEREEK